MVAPQPHAVILFVVVWHDELTPITASSLLFALKAFLPYFDLLERSHTIACWYFSAKQDQTVFNDGKSCYCYLFVLECDQSWCWILTFSCMRRLSLKLDPGSPSLEVTALGRSHKARIVYKATIRDLLPAISKHLRCTFFVTDQSS